MDNPQETYVSYIAGLIDGEGSFYLYKVKTRSWESYRACIQFTNTDPELVQAFVDFCKQNLIGYHIYTDKRIGKAKRCYQVQVTTMDSRIRFIELIKPYLRGIKRYESELVYRFIQNRIRKNKEHVQAKDPKTGRIMASTKSNHDAEDIALYDEYKTHKGSSTTTRETPINFG